ncbi:MAG TPA: hypothetical protein VNA20_06505 [Frankiaceae bacterium]|nr:hypothetical protein [Frankiaceae bacterium]
MTRPDRLDRRCRWVARAYPGGARRVEVAATLADANDGRRAPRLADAFDVVWHGLVARLRGGTPSRRFGVWGDAAAVAVVQALVLQAATAAVLATRVYEKPASEYPLYPYRPGFGRGGPLFYSHAEAYVAVVAAVLGVAAAVLACRGRVLGARVATATAGLGVAAAVAASRLTGNEYTFGSFAARVAAGLSVALAVCVVVTPAVARAAAVVPSWWWRVSAGLAAAIALAAMLWDPYLVGGGRATVLLASYAMQAGALLVVSAPLALRAPAVSGAAVLLATGALALLARVVDGSHTDMAHARVLEATFGAGGALVLLTAAVVTRRRA